MKFYVYDDIFMYSIIKAKKKNGVLAFDIHTQEEVVVAYSSSWFPSHNIYIEKDNVSKLESNY